MNLPLLLLVATNLSVCNFVFLNLLKIINKQMLIIHELFAPKCPRYCVQSRVYSWCTLLVQDSAEHFLWKQRQRTRWRQVLITKDFWLATWSSQSLWSPMLRMLAAEAMQQRSHERRSAAGRKKPNQTDPNSSIQAWAPVGLWPFCSNWKTKIDWGHMHVQLKLQKRIAFGNVSECDCSQWPDNCPSNSMCKPEINKLCRKKTELNLFKIHLWVHTNSTST